jgi:RNA polymerase subunit RPABC4/transcription elongation factor Spt4
MTKFSHHESCPECGSKDNVGVWEDGHNLPDVAKSWLDQYGITDQEIRRLSIVYNKKTRRLVLPLLDKWGNVLVYQQRKLFEDDPKPKYLTTGGVNGVIWFPRPLDDYPEIDTVVVVEDIVSAIKVGRHIPCMPLLGTNLPVNTAVRLSETFSGLIVWLDPDKKKEAHKLAIQFSGVFERTGTIWSEKDPKDYSNADIISFAY